MEIKSLCFQVNIWGKNGKEVSAEIEKFFNGDEYKSASDKSLLSLILLSLNEPSYKNFDLIEDALENMVITHDWYSGYLCSLVFSAFASKTIDCSEEDEKGRLFKLLYKSFQYLKKADQTAIDTDRTINHLRLIFSKINSLHTKRAIKELQSYYNQLMKAQLASIYRRTMSIWMLKKNYGAVAEAYYRLLRPYIVSQLPSNIVAWLDVENYETFIKEGFNLLKKYQKKEGVLIWPIIHIIKNMELRARREQDTRVKETLANAWLQAGVQCVEGLLEAANLSDFLASDLKKTLGDHLKEIREFTAEQRKHRASGTYISL